ncbi:MAG: type I methionyl aminopeptidase [Chloroflexi bacterium]|nr:type I methionyl aminopeptidase [Chloroflexota bacterium]
MTVTTEEELRALQAIGRIVGLTIKRMSEHLAPGITTAELDAVGAAVLAEHGARSAPMLAYNFPGHTCISINDEAAHGIPSERAIQPGDMVNIDVSAEKDGFWADSGASFAVPPVSEQKAGLIAGAKQALTIAMEAARAGQPINAVGAAVQRFAYRSGYHVIFELTGHGVGRHIHEEPHIPNIYDPRRKQPLTEGLVVTLEPFLTLGAQHIVTMPDGWTLCTEDGSLVAQFEHTVVITQGQPLAVTAVPTN